MTVHYLPTAAEQIQIERSSAHAVAEVMLDPRARFAAGVTDLDVARVMLALERGTPVTRLPNGRWVAPVGAPVSSWYRLSTVVQEMIRTGLVTDYRPAGGHAAGFLAGTRLLLPAKTHLKRWDGEHWRSVCGVPGEGLGPKRVRLVGDAVMVDCLTCIDRL